MYSEKSDTWKGILAMKEILRKLLKAGRLLMFNPILFFRKIYSEMLSLYPFSRYPVLKRINGVIFKFDFAYDPVVKHMFCGEYETGTVVLMKSFLREGDTFIDIGANIGYLSAIAAGLVGNRGQVHSFEPVPRYFLKLQDVALRNPGYSIYANQIALGQESSVAKISITNLPNIGWNTLVSGFMSPETIKEVIEVPVRRFDVYALEHAVRHVSLIKIDTEGFELPVLRGLSGFLEETKALPVIICEIAPGAYPFLGQKLDELAVYMKSYGYEAFAIDDRKRKVDIRVLSKTTNVVFVPSKR